MSDPLDDESYEVLYDEYVRNKPCFERHVSIDRISLLHEEELPSSKDNSHADHIPPEDLDPSPLINSSADIFIKLHQVGWLIIYLDFATLSILKI